MFCKPKQFYQFTIHFKFCTFAPTIDRLFLKKHLIFTVIEIDLY